MARYIDRFAPTTGNHNRTAEGEEHREVRTARARIVAEHIPPPSRARPFWLFGVDTTPNPRPLAATLSDRGVVYQPNPAPGNKPIVVGHLFGCGSPTGASPPGSSQYRGHPTWYGPAFRLADPGTWGTPAQTAELQDRTNKGRRLRIRIERRNDLLMRGHRDCPMHSRPFDLFRCCVFDAETGKLVFQRPLWLIARGRRRAALTLEQIYVAYRQRFDLERFFRFGKNRLLLDKFLTPEVQHEERWWQLVCLAFIQLWLAAALANALPKSWERYLPKRPSGTVCPTTRVQRDFERIIHLVGTPARSPERRDISPGRRQGARPDRRPRLPVIFKGKRNRQTATCSAR